MNEPRLECFACMAAASGVPQGYRIGCATCLDRAMEAFYEPEVFIDIRLDDPDGMPKSLAAAFPVPARFHR